MSGPSERVRRSVPRFPSRSVMETPVLVEPANSTDFRPHHRRRPSFRIPVVLVPLSCANHPHEPTLWAAINPICYIEWGWVDYNRLIDAPDDSVLGPVHQVLAFGAAVRTLVGEPALDISHLATLRTRHMSSASPNDCPDRACPTLIASAPSRVVTKKPLRSMPRIAWPISLPSSS